MSIHELMESEYDKAGIAVFGFAASWMCTFYRLDRNTQSSIHGFASAGGCELAMMADLVVAADDTKIGHPVISVLG